MKLISNKLVNIGMVLGMGIVFVIGMYVDTFHAGAALIDLFGSAGSDEEQT